MAPVVLLLGTRSREVVVTDVNWKCRNTAWSNAPKIEKRLRSNLYSIKPTVNGGLEAPSCDLQTSVRSMAR